MKTINQLISFDIDSVLLRTKGARRLSTKHAMRVTSIKSALDSLNSLFDVLHV